MSSTRHAPAGAPLRQERFSSSFQQGLLANLVAKRCAEIAAPADRAAIWFAQSQSWKAGGLGALAAELLRRFPLPEWRAQVQPSLLLGETWKTALKSAIEQLCLNPRAPLSEVWDALDAYRAMWLSELPERAETSVGRQVGAALEYTRSAGTLTLIDGPARIGKTFAAQEWCQRSGGLARYAQVPCSNDDVSFFRAIAQALGVSSSLQLKAAEIRGRVEEVLQAGDLMLVLDEAHYAWPQRWQRYAMPSRVNWIMTALVNHGVAVALVTTPQFYTAQKRVEGLTGWTSEQFIGRIGHLERLPEKLEKSDLLAVARAMLPEGEDATLKALAGYAVLSKKHLASIKSIVDRSRWLAGMEGRKEVSADDVRRAMKESVIPSDNALAASLAAPEKTPRGSFARLPRPHRGYAAAPAPAVPNAAERGKSRIITTAPSRGSLVSS